MASPSRRLLNPILFVCDLQEKFRPAIYQYPAVLATTQKLLQASKILNFPVVATTQLKGKLGETCPELQLDCPGGIQTLVHADKSLFSMWTDEVKEALRNAGKLSPGGRPLEVVIVGIESHICVAQTTLDLLKDNHKVYVLADGVSSCNKEEIPIALARLRAQGAIVTTSESWLYECMGDAGIQEFRDISKLVKDTKDSTKESMQALCKM
ncbi:Isochorismatase hydrolase [Eremomyces bilateralis CBS 781.70]|uniref:Isochorismatase hydrolase n=1 Tax=Eremomyces bilateralis CBS 781.70 TaxID=1392243 RepID=A0A6G1G397_9PEZI|nr:Isochorismatase hydrolase [Eremomyces bilateralis CBS 781.70]KAF1812462.1 Isochorismatase hydrolase [Eremomyces bilateralis CBS 781.70]